MNQAATHRQGDPLAIEVQYIRGVGPIRGERLRRLKIATGGDLIHFAPREYEDLRSPVCIRNLHNGCKSQVLARLERVRARETRAGIPVVEALFSDDTGFLNVVWFNRPLVAEAFRLQQEYRIAGKAELRTGRWQMANPSIEPAEDQNASELRPTLLPVYPATEGLNQAALRRIMRSALHQLAHLVPEVTPAETRRELRMGPIAKTIWSFHFPVDRTAATRARNRLAFDELLVLQTALAVKRAGQRKLEAARILTNRKVDERIRRLFPFQFTPAQNHVISEVVADLAKNEPMYRLIQGDVGAGKTAVAAYAILSTIANGFQAAFLAPTEVLARQHYRTFDELLSRSSVRRLLLTGGMPGKARAECLRWLAEGDYDLVVGTHALLEPSVRFRQLGLVVIDEQHKFGVRQRAELQRFAPAPHQLVMTATPIPRSLGLTWFGDLDVSILQGKPPGRLETLNYVVAAGERRRAYQFVHKQIGPASKALIVCPRIERMEAGRAMSVQEIAAELMEQGIPANRIGVVHGGMDERGKDSIVQGFRSGGVWALVATIVVEVGLDVPTANIVVIENAELFGMSQLHQIRGRVGRGDDRGICFLINHSSDPRAAQRLRLFSRTNDGFVIAEQDAKIRGIGEFIGERQHGGTGFRFADLFKDLKILELARREARRIVDKDPALAADELAPLRRAVIERYGKMLNLARIG